MVIIRSRRGLIGHIARSLGLTRGAVAKWDRVPAERVAKVEAATGIPRYLLRPDLFAAPEGMGGPKKPRPKPKVPARKKKRKAQAPKAPPYGPIEAAGASS